MFIAGGVDNFELGPLSVRGARGPRASLECHVGTSLQQLTLDGAVSLFNIDAQIYVHIQFMPSPELEFSMSVMFTFNKMVSDLTHRLLSFAEIFMFQLDAKLIGSLGANIRDADFSLDATLNNDILEYVARQIMEQLEAAKVAALQGLEAAREKVRKAREDWENGVSDAERKLEKAQRDWEAFERSIRNSNQPIIDRFRSEITRLQRQIEYAQKDYENALRDAERAVEKANRDRGAELAKARENVRIAKRDMNYEIDKAQRALDYAEADLHHAFGDAQREIDKAKADVWRIGNNIRDVKNTIYEYDKAHWTEFWKKAAIPGLWITVGALEAARHVAIAALDTAKGILTGTQYVAKVGAVDLAREGLKTARTLGQEALTDAEGALWDIDKVTRDALYTAQNFLEDVRYGGKYVIFQGAKDALQKFKDVQGPLFDAAVDAIATLMKSGAYIAFTTAKALLKAARGYTKLLDLANESLKLAEKASAIVLTILQKLAKFGARAINIQEIHLSGTLRGILGVGGNQSRPFSAEVKGYLIGVRFDLRVELDPSDAVAFVSSVFKK